MPVVALIPIHFTTIEPYACGSLNPIHFTTIEPYAYGSLNPHPQGKEKEKKGIYKLFPVHAKICSQ